MFLEYKENKPIKRKDRSSKFQDREVRIKRNKRWNKKHQYTEKDERKGIGGAEEKTQKK